MSSNPYLDSKEKYVDISLRGNHKLKVFFNNISNPKGLLEPYKLFELLKREFQEISDPMIELMKQVFANFKIPVDFSIYCEIVKRFIGIDEGLCKQILFNVLDVNKDNRVCETDLFNIHQMIHSAKVRYLLSDDLMHVMQFMQKFRQQSGMMDEVQYF